MAVTLKDDFYFDNHTLTIREFTVTDQDVISFFRDFKELPELREKFEKVLKMGVVVTKTVDIAEKIDYVEKEFNKLDTKFEGSLNSMLEDLTTKSEIMFGDEGKFSTLLEEHFGKDGQVVKNIFDPYKEGTPLYNLRKEIKTEIEGLKEQFGINKGIEQFKQKTTHKGFDFEIYCENILADIVRVNGDNLEKTSTKPGKLLKNKTGDYVVTFGNNVGKKLVIELKDIDKQLSVAEIQKELEEAKENRNSDFAIFVVRHVESIPKSTGWFAEYNGANLVCALGSKDGNDNLHEEILCIAYKWAKSKLFVESLRDKKIDPAFVNRQIEVVKNKLKILDGIATHCNNIERSSEEVKNILKRNKDEIDSDLTKIITSMKANSPYPQRGRSTENTAETGGATVW
jgi:hypothetical protein